MSYDGLTNIETGLQKDLNDLHNFAMSRKLFTTISDDPQYHAINTKASGSKRKADGSPAMRLNKRQKIAGSLAAATGSVADTFRGQMSAGIIDQGDRDLTADRGQDAAISDQCPTVLSRQSKWLRANEDCERGHDDLQHGHADSWTAADMMRKEAANFALDHFLQQPSRLTRPRVRFSLEPPREVQVQFATTSFVITKSLTHIEGDDLYVYFPTCAKKLLAARLERYYSQMMDGEVYHLDAVLGFIGSACTCGQDHWHSMGWKTGRRISWPEQNLGMNKQALRASIDRLMPRPPLDAPLLDQVTMRKRKMHIEKKLKRFRNRNNWTALKNLKGRQPHLAHSMVGFW